MRGSKQTLYSITEVTAAGPPEALRHIRGRHLCRQAAAAESPLRALQKSGFSAFGTFASLLL
jgi:hypothetical protein